jgi:hypothetical protein
LTRHTPGLPRKLAEFIPSSIGSASVAAYVAGNDQISNSTGAGDDQNINASQQARVDLASNTGTYPGGDQAIAGGSSIARDGVDNSVDHEVSYNTNVEESCNMDIDHDDGDRVERP